MIYIFQAFSVLTHVKAETFGAILRLGNPLEMAWEKKFVVLFQQE